MNKQEFLAALREGFAGLPQDEIEERLNFYGEMLEDQMEEGLSEEEAVLAIGPAEEIVRQVLADIPLGKVVKERLRPKRRLNAWEIVLLALGAPLWLSLGLAAAAVILAVYAALWAVLAALWVVFGAAAACAAASVPACIVMAARGRAAAGFAALSIGIVCAGLCIFLFFGCQNASKGILALTKRISLWVKRRLIRKEEAQ